jgi:uroporphyrin-III C-methyltransferase / precorrin-2 dehydrogenase / sirohydrochlorin ferrochelatase
MYPVMLEVRDRLCLVVGGGGVALRKVEGLWAEGARVTVVAPDPVPGLERLAGDLTVVLERRPYREGEAADYALVFAATDDREVNRRVFQDAEAAGVWSNVADDPELCSFHLPARVQRGPMQIAIASAGEAPFVVRRMRQLFERLFGTEWAEWMEAAGRFRREVRRLDLEPAESERRYDTFFEETVDPVRFVARVPTEEEEEVYLAGSRAVPETDEEAPSTGRERHRETERPAETVGFVSLVGAGPGDPGLLTVRGRRRLHAADVIVYDRLALTALPCDLPAEVELHGVGKQASRHPVPQEEINALLVRLAREGKRVVRFKGGDPYVFGRGSEEAEELVRAGVPFEIVPAVTAGIAVPAYAGIPVTHRREAVRVTIVTAHEARKTDGSQVRWDLMAGDPHATILGYMGVTQIGDVVAELLAAGLDPKTPAAMIERGTTSAQRVVRSTVSRLPEDIVEAGLQPPGLFVIGRTVARGERLDWFGRRPLLGERLILPPSADALAEELELAGAELLRVPLPLTPAARLVLDALPVTGCVVGQADEVDSLDEERDGAGWQADAAIWCLGPQAAVRARELGWRVVEELPDFAGADDLATAIAARPRGNRAPRA